MARIGPCGTRPCRRQADRRCAQRRVALESTPIVGLAAVIASFLSGLLSVKVITGLTMVQAIAGSLLGVIRHHSHGNVSKADVGV